VGPFEVLPDVLRDSFDYGQFRSACITIILLFAIWRLTPAGLAQVLIALIEFAERRSSIGYCLALISLIGCWLHTGYKSQVEAQIMRRTVVDLEDVYKMLEEAQKD